MTLAFATHIKKIACSSRAKQNGCLSTEMRADAMGNIIFILAKRKQPEMAGQFNETKT